MIIFGTLQIFSLRNKKIRKKSIDFATEKYCGIKNFFFSKLNIYSPTESVLSDVNWNMKDVDKTGSKPRPEIINNIRARLEW